MAWIKSRKYLKFLSEVHLRVLTLTEKDIDINVILNRSNQKMAPLSCDLMITPDAFFFKKNLLSEFEKTLIFTELTSLHRKAKKSETKMYVRKVEDFITLEMANYEMRKGLKNKSMVKITTPISVPAAPSTGSCNFASGRRAMPINVEVVLMSGKSAKLWVDLETYVEDLRPRVCKIWGSGVGLQILSQALGFIGFRGLGV
ncbi:unnamed protein product [Symbiodinium sp. KB8]|nr:unnamed protein product [Symbiodinium sp. KB8]